MSRLVVVQRSEHLRGEAYLCPLCSGIITAGPVVGLVLPRLLADRIGSVIDHLTRWNTAKEHGRRGRRVEYSIGWPVDERTRDGIEQLPETAWAAGPATDGQAVPGEQVADLTGLLRDSRDGDRLDGWPDDLRVIVSRTPRGASEQAALGEDAAWRHGAFATNTPDGQLQWLDARHRTRPMWRTRSKS